MNNSREGRPLPRCLQVASAAEHWNAPLDTRDLATRLETDGVTDDVAASDFGYTTTWDMAEAWLPRLLALQPVERAREKRHASWRDYATGISFALPLLCSIVVFTLFHVALWGGDLSSEEAAAVGLGTVVSFLLTGGWVQAMTRRGHFFMGTKQFRRAEQSTWHWMRLSSSVLGVSVLMLFLMSSYWGWLPVRLGLTAAAFSAALGFLWLATGTLHIHERGVMVVWVTLGGIALVGILHQAFGLPLLPSQLLAIVISALASLAIASHFFTQQLEKSPGVPFQSSLLRDIYNLWPYFTYGILYYILLFSDRLMAWTAGTYASALLIEFRGGYESALNIGLLAFVFQVGWVHYAVAGFYRKIAEAESHYDIDAVAEFRDSMRRYYWIRLAWFTPIPLAAGALSFGIAYLAGYLKGDTATMIALWSLGGFPFLVVGLWNVSLLFGLNNASKATAAAAMAGVVNICTGYIASRIGGYPYAVVGFTVGSIAFALLSGVFSLRALRRLDYFHFNS
ncbi:MAG TPA: hypothetical protein VFB63_19955 [Bryobacteraceae bacterium]|jgi:hypothetical protein|nr:hypothetical protein [Bryobacteraceae bacterium]